MAKRTVKNPRAVRKSSVPKQKEPTIGETAQGLLMKPNMTYDDVVAEIHRLFPGSATSVKSVQWYASRMRADGLRVPDRSQSAEKPIVSRGSRRGTR